MIIPLKGMVRARQPKRKIVIVRPIHPTQVMADDLYFGAYLPIVEEWTRALSSVKSAYERSLPALGTRDAVPDIENAIERATEQITRLILGLSPNLRRWTLRTERWHRGKWRSGVMAATNIDIDMMMSLGDVTETVDAFLARNVALMRDISAQAQARISDIVFRGFQEVRPIREVARELDDAIGMSRARAIRVASDQTSKLSAALDQARQEQVGGRKFKWHHSRKKHPRREHIERDGNIYAWNDEAIVDDKPGMAPFCGCRAGFVLELDD
jgi:SPP1 gp7 family putative phage head morphogenesis protein